MSHLHNIEKKLMNSSQLIDQLNAWQKEGCKIVFSNGCFDILHLGHIDYLARAADFGDKMVIGLNTDSSVSKIKGPTRPINDERSRAMVLAALEFVSAIILFDEPTPYELIRLVQPDVLVKGADYKPEEIVGYDIVTAKGGSVKTIPFVDGYSTTRIEQRIRNA
ncbi:MAG: D-glycero-beta-D-manno-heptose 1-phosphate adenylyltransferase [Bacteroidia bacterium]|nr:D-glycero-beta-D-manno-heptose 1-phosphate adenylyltransferase [Bacteroidia bacterium]MBP7243833.1 D-glycero-beta-D-manno-heptose 1-phosphate adenylyltransferase [Bacteroidia bacterium]